MSETTKTHRRYHLRLGTQCNNRCVHCTVADIAHLADRDTEQVVEALQKGRDVGCTEVVFMRGEPLIRPDIIQLVGQARKLGYRHVQVQTNGRMLAYTKAVRTLLRVGVSFFEISIYGADAAAHDAISGVPGSFKQTMAGIANVAALGAPHLVSVPIIAQNFETLPAIVTRLAELNVGSVKLNFSRPVQSAGRWQLETMVRLSMVSSFVRDAYRVGARFGIAIQVEAIPFCHLEAHMHPGADATEDWGRHVVGDLHHWHDSMTDLRQTTRGDTSQCSGCLHEADCPRTWEPYLTLFGGGELFRIDPSSRGGAA